MFGYSIIKGSPDLPLIPAGSDAERSDPAAEPRRSCGSQDLLLQHKVLRREQNLQTRCAGHHSGGEFLCFILHDI